MKSGLRSRSLGLEIRAEGKLFGICNTAGCWFGRLECSCFLKMEALCSLDVLPGVQYFCNATEITILGSKP